MRRCLILPATAISEGVEQPDQNADGDDDDNDGNQRHRMLTIGNKCFAQAAAFAVSGL